jgi:WD40 repeat protein
LRQRRHHPRLVPRHRFSGQGAGHRACRRRERIGVNRDADEVVSASIDGSIRCWDRETGAPRGRLRAPDGWVIAISPDNRQIVRVGEDDEIVRWDALTHDQITPSLTGHAGGVRAVAFTPDSRQLVTVGADGTVRRWERDTGEPVGEPMTGHRGAVNAVAVTPDGRHLVTAGRNDGAVVLWDAATGRSVWRARGGDRGGALTVAVNRAGDRVVSGGNGGAIDVWDLHSGEQTGSIAQPGVVTVVRFTPDDRHIVSGGVDGTVRRWDAETMALVDAPFAGHVDTVTSLAFPDKAVLLSGSADGTVRRWDLITGIELGAESGAARPTAHGLADVLSDLESSEDRLDIAGDVLGRAHRAHVPGARQGRHRHRRGDRRPGRRSEGGAVRPEGRT